MSQEYKKKIGIPVEHDFVQIDHKWQQKRGQDTDTYQYNEIDKEGEIVGKYIVIDSTSIYPPFDNDLSWEKIA